MAGNTPTMKDVAQEAGVSLGTVSKVFNGIPVGTEYRQKVEQAAKKLNYQVNQYARGLRAGQTYTVAVILPGIDHGFFAPLAQQLYNALNARGRRMLLYLTASRPELEQECFSMVRQNKVDGIIGLTYNPIEMDGAIPFVSIDRNFCSAVPCVSSDNYAGGRMAAEKLLELGCKRLAFIRTGSPFPSEADKRGDGFEMACRSNQRSCQRLWLNDGDDWGQIEDFLRTHLSGCEQDIDGIFCSTDILAVHVRQMLEEIGRRVPEEVQIIGFDGMRQLLGGEAFYCSTIVQPIQKMAATCVDLLLDKGRSNTPALVCLPVSYVPGGTTKEEPWQANI